MQLEDCPHVAFRHQAAQDKTVPPRESFEIRALVFTYPKNAESEQSETNAWIRKRVLRIKRLFYGGRGTWEVRKQLRCRDFVMQGGGRASA